MYPTADMNLLGLNLKKSIKPDQLSRNAFKKTGHSLAGCIKVGLLAAKDENQKAFIF
jgi:hypothetical protein